MVEVNVTNASALPLPMASRYVFDLARHQLQRVDIVAEALRPFPLLTDRLLRCGERHDGRADRAKRRDGEQPGPAHGAHHAARGDAD